MEEPCKHLEEHARSDERMFESIFQTLANIRDNHITHMTKDISEVRTDVSWLKENNSKQQTLMYGILSGLMLLFVGMIMTYFK